MADKLFSFKYLMGLREGKHRVDKGLYLQVRGNSRSWLFRYMKDHHEHWIGIGPLADVSLSKARLGADKIRSDVARGINPRDVAPIIQTTRTMDDAINEFIRNRGARWRPRYTRDFAACMRKYVSPVMGGTPINAITTQMVLDTLPDKGPVRSVMDRKLQQRLHTVLTYGQAMGWRDGPNPARWDGHLEFILPEKVSKVWHHAALPWRELPAMMSKLSTREGPAALALEFTILTAARSGEVRMARHREIDFDSRIWTIPPEHNKTGKPHRIPLSDAATRLIFGNRYSQDPSALLFPGIINKPLAITSMMALVRRMGYANTVHGFRSTFRDWVAECTDFPGELAEMSLAHRVMNNVEAAYRRGDQIEKRRPLMQAWSDFANGVKLPGVA